MIERDSIHSKQFVHSSLGCVESSQFKLDIITALLFGALPTRISPRSHHARSIFPAQTVNVCNEKFNLIESKK